MFLVIIYRYLPSKRTRPKEQSITCENGASLAFNLFNGQETSCQRMIKLLLKCRTTNLHVVNMITTCVMFILPIVEIND